MSFSADLQEAMARRLSETMKAKSVSQTELAQKIGTTKQQVYKLEKGHVRLRDEWARKIAPHLGVKAEWLLFLDGDMEPQDGSLRPSGFGNENYVPVAALDTRAGAGGCGIVHNDSFRAPHYFDIGFITQKLRACPEDLCLVEIEGQSMEPLLQHGDLVLVDRRKTNISMEGIFVLHDGNGIVCKWVERCHESDIPKIVIKSENKRFSEYYALIDEIRIIGRVVWYSRTI